MTSASFCSKLHFSGPLL